ncbi:MAG: hypothetical protein H7A53_09805 [Akkermansiaceae bacterium]|nr:hypothetical protein [Akkermansiaceae bacterium]MCP5551170.1 hypothetical protein [Akkermansiaceae bacterium]
MTQPCSLPPLSLAGLAFFALAAWFPGHTRAEDLYEMPPINYSDTEPSDSITRLEAAMEKGEVKFRPGAPDKEFMDDLTKEMGLPASSQVLVFSKTSLQNPHINPRQPRAIYFNEDLYLGWSHGSQKFEVIAADPKLGATFYLLEREPETAKIEVFRESADCFSCHASGRTGGRPGMLVRSLFTDREGQPIFSAGSYTVGQETPFENRWGGWYVTGFHGDARHLGNLTATELPDGRAEYDREPGANLLSLDAFFDTGDYLAPTSDIVALMVLEHQIGMHNKLIEGNFTVRAAVYRSRQLNRELGADNPDELSDSTKRIIESQADRILSHMVYRDEAPLPEGGVDSKGRFPAEFQHNARPNQDGRSLKDFQLLDRLFKYRCSYMIYSEAFTSLPPELKDRVLARLADGLRGGDKPEIFDHLSESERDRIREILDDTLPGFAKL